ncbi:hypothetical protein P7C71_g260, partial [Lecanoromycetidae sp. Uapishka_2]
MSDAQIKELRSVAPCYISDCRANEGWLRQEAEHMFYHGFDNYIEHAFPEDELKPLSCQPLTRDRANPGHIELNDPLGNYSITLIDSLSTLAILASSSTTNKGNKALEYFQRSVEALVEQYGDGRSGDSGKGKRARGFDVDSKVQVFETVIRGVGGLLSAHLFAVGELPIKGYNVGNSPSAQSWEERRGAHNIQWPNEFVYDGQLLRLAHDLSRRLLPAFQTVTGLPYPRVNLRHGVPFYVNSPLNQNAETGQCPPTQHPSGEATETCSAGAGSLILELTILSRLTGDTRFEQLGKRAFWSVWERKSSIGLVGSGIDAETGLWTNGYTGIGAGIDSFYEYAAKASVLLSGTPFPDTLVPISNNGTPTSTQGTLVTHDHQTAEAFGRVWQESQVSIKRHLLRGSNYIHPHYVQADLYTGASRAFWLDSLSAFYPGLLATMGHLEEATEAHLLATALWTRYSALPERWSASTGSIEGGLGWWGGRPEFIESTYHLYRATRDPWYLHVGEMVLRDIKRRCWTKCGWSGLQDVRSGERNDRMESFFLGETTKYLFLLFDPGHPLNHIDAPHTFDITFPTTPNTVIGPGFLQRVGNGILINSMGGVRLGMIQDVPFETGELADQNQYRVQAINNILLGKDESIFIAKDTASNVVNPLDPNFTRVQDKSMLDLVVDVASVDNGERAQSHASSPLPKTGNSTQASSTPTPEIEIDSSLATNPEVASNMKQAFSSLLQQMAGLITVPAAPSPAPKPNPSPREYIAAIMPVGIGVGPMPEVEEALGPDIHGAPQGDLLFHSIYVTGENCKRDPKLPLFVPRENEILVIKRGSCSFDEKLRNIPTFAPTGSSLKLVVVVSYDEEPGLPSDYLIRPLLEATQTTSSGLPRHNPIPMVMVAGGERIYSSFERAIAVGIKRRYSVQAQGIPISNLVML